MVPILAGIHAVWDAATAKPQQKNCNDMSL